MKVVLLWFMSLFLITASRAQDGKDVLTISWPNEYRWKICDEKTGQELLQFRFDEPTYKIELVPANETTNNWTIKGRVEKFDGTKMVDNLTEIADTIFSQQKEKSPKVKFKRIEKNNSYLLFKIEHASPEHNIDNISTLYYLTIGGYGRLYLVSVSIHKDSLSDKFVAKWSNIFKQSQLLVW